MGESGLGQRPGAGVVIGGYELVRRIGRGGMAEVWVASRPMGAKGSKYVAIKLLADHYVGDERYCRMFRAEVELAAVLSHANIVQVFDEGEDRGRNYLIMEWVDGLNLLKVRTVLTVLGDEGRRLRVIAYIIGQLLHALKYAHSITSVDGSPLGVVHRDVSPQNVLVSNQGEVKLTDFGVAYQVSEESSGIHVKGKIRYMAPEQLIGQSHSPTVDLYAVGALLHEMLDGIRFREGGGNAQELISTVLSGAIPPLSRPVSPELERLRLGLLQKDPKRRVQTATEALIMLKQYPGYGDARDELTELCQGLTGVVRPRTGPGQSSQVPMTDRSTSPFSPRDLEGPVGRSMTSSVSKGPAPVIAPPPPFGSTSGGGGAGGVTPVLLSGNAVFLDLRTSGGAEAGPGLAVVQDPAPDHACAMALGAASSEPGEDSGSSTSLVSTPSEPPQTTMLSAPSKGSGAASGADDVSNPTLRQPSPDPALRPSPTATPMSPPRAFPTPAVQGPSTVSPAPHLSQVSPVPYVPAAAAVAQPWGTPAHGGWPQPADPWARQVGPGHPSAMGMQETGGSTTDREIVPARMPGDGTDTSMHSFPAPNRSNVSSAVVAVAIALVVVVSSSLAAAWLVFGRDDGDPSVAMLDADAPSVHQSQALVPVHPSDEAEDDGSNQPAALDLDEVPMEQTPVEDEPDTLEDEIEVPAEAEVADLHVPPPPATVEPKTVPRTRVRVQAQPGLSDAQLSIGAQVISVGKLRDRSVTVKVGRRRMKWRSKRDGRWESAGSLVLRQGRTVTLLITPNGVKKLSS